MNSNTNWNLYRAFIAVFETKNLQRAAEILNVTRSAIGQNIKELERQLGTKLFVGHSKGVEPTSDAITLYESIKDAHKSITDGESNIQEFTKDSHGLIRLSIPPTLVRADLRDYIMEFCKTYPNVRFEFHRGNVELLEQNKIDFAFNVDTVFHGYNFDKTTLFRGAPILIASKKFLRKNSLTDVIKPTDLLNLPLIIHREFVHWAQSATGLDFKPHIETASSDTVFEFVKEDLGIGYFFEESFYEFNNNNDVVLLKLDGVELLGIKIVCAHNKEYLTKAANMFLEGLIKFCKEKF
ncbi:MAG: LysR family transcriptional regulator [Firmicutes bacterium]|nr:LysR family transcriptional regulator [Bacillota bacterium]